MISRAAIRIARRAFMAEAIFMMFVVAAAAQDLEPRAYSPAPVGTNFATLTYATPQETYCSTPPSLFRTPTYLQQNVRVGLTFALPLTRAQSLKFQYTRGAITRVGGDFTSLAATYQFRWTTRR